MAALLLRQYLCCCLPSSSSHGADEVRSLLLLSLMNSLTCTLHRTQSEHLCSTPTSSPSALTLRPIPFSAQADPPPPPPRSGRPLDPKAARPRRSSASASPSSASSSMPQSALSVCFSLASEVPQLILASSLSSRTQAPDQCRVARRLPPLAPRHEPLRPTVLDIFPRRVSSAAAQEAPRVVDLAPAHGRHAPRAGASRPARAQLGRGACSWVWVSEGRLG